MSVAFIILEITVKEGLKEMMNLAKGYNSKYSMARVIVLVLKLLCMTVKLNGNSCDTFLESQTNITFEVKKRKFFTSRIVWK